MAPGIADFAVVFIEELVTLEGFVAVVDLEQVPDLFVFVPGLTHGSVFNIDSTI